MDRVCPVCEKINPRLWTAGKCSTCYRRLRYSLSTDTELAVIAERKRLYRIRRPQIEERYTRQPNRRFAQGQTSAKTRKLSWTLTFEEFCKIIEPNRCHYCRGKLSPSGCALDRIDNKIGYETNNVVPCCGECNFMRGRRLTPDEVKVAVRAIHTHRKSLKKKAS